MIPLQEILNAANPDEAFQWLDKVSIKFLSRLLVDVACVFVLIRYIYFRHYKRSDLFLTFFGFNFIIFLVTYLLNKVEMSMGAAFGLFAVFSMLRYRTEDISTKDMTYLFLCIAIGLITSISKGTWDDLGMMSLILLLATELLEGGWLMKKEFSTKILYGNMDLIKPDKREELMEELKSKTGLNIQRVEIENYNLKASRVGLKIYYYV